MNKEWNLSLVYKGIDDPKYLEDIEVLKNKLEEFSSSLTKTDGSKELEKILRLKEEVYVLFTRLGFYQSLRISTNTEDGELIAENAKLERLLAQYAGDFSSFDKLLGSVENLDELAKKSELIADYSFLIKEAKKNLSHLLPDGEEVIFSAMDQTGGMAWGSLQSYLTSTVKAEYREKILTLSEVRNLAFDKDPEVRLEAYEAEKKACEKIQDSVAFALNNIKNQVNFEAKKRGFSSPLKMTLEMSRMSEDTLNALMGAINDALPDIRKYFRKKAELLGHNGALPWQDLFAPVGSYSKIFSAEEAKDYLISAFDNFSPEISGLIREAFENEWIDFYPKSGKVGGAFCSGLQELKQSRILTNFDGSFSAVDTLAHELGHAFHNRQMENNRPLLCDYPMPIAETASTLNEVHLGKFALEKATTEEKLGLLDSNLREKTQTTVDIYSRYLFESAVFGKVEDKFLMADDLNSLMVKCQKLAYGDGLDESTLHKGMWIVKAHYYSSALSFYNFPYAFGSLFAQGLYKMFEEEKDAFFPKYKKMLSLTSQCTMEEAGYAMGADLTKKDFWKKSLESLQEMIDEFCTLSVK